MKYLFLDLDGTICESKQPCTEDMRELLKRLSKTYNIVIVSGAELERAGTQVELPVTYMSQNGNQVLYKGKTLWKNYFGGRKEVTEHINSLIKEWNADYTLDPIVLGDDMIDDRGSQISFSFVGHHAPFEEKKAFDPERKIRAALLDKLPFKGAVIGGTTCIDYVPKTKGENIQRFLTTFKIRPIDCLYIGDAFIKHGNDETVMGYIPVHKVSSPEDTKKFLKYL